MTAVHQAVLRTLAGVGSEIISLFIEAKEARVAITVGNKDGAIWRGNRCCKPPCIGRFKTGLGRRANFLNHSAIWPESNEKPILLRRALLHCRIKDFVAVLFRANHRMYFGILAENRLK